LSTVFAIGLVFYLVFAILGVSQSGKEDFAQRWLLVVSVLRVYSI